MEVEKLIKLFNGSQKEMAAKLGTTESRISEYKKGKHAITVEKLRNWCDILEINIRDVIINDPFGKEIITEEEYYNAKYIVNEYQRRLKTEKLKEKIINEIKLSNGMSMLKSNYIKLKTKELKDFGYTNITEKEVSEQIEKILYKEDDLSLIGMMCKVDFDLSYLESL